MLDQLHFFLVGCLQTFRHQILWYILRNSNLSVIYFLSNIVDRLNKHIFFLSVGAKLFLKFWRFQQFFFEIKLLIKIDLMSIEGCPNIIDSIPKSIKFLFTDGNFLNDCILEVIIFIGYQIVKTVDLCLSIL